MTSTLKKKYNRTADEPAGPAPPPSFGKDWKICKCSGFILKGIVHQKHSFTTDGVLGEVIEFQRNSEGIFWGEMLSHVQHI